MTWLLLLQFESAVLLFFFQNFLILIDSRLSHLWHFNNRLFALSFRVQLMCSDAPFLAFLFLWLHRSCVPELVLFLLPGSACDPTLAGLVSGGGVLSSAVCCRTHKPESQWRRPRRRCSFHQVCMCRMCIFFFFCWRAEGLMIIKSHPFWYVISRSVSLLVFYDHLGRES